MERRCNLLCRVIGFIIAGIAASAGAAPPNLLVILTDDQGWGDLSAHGNQNLSTPHIDALAKSGATCERFYVCPVCSPTRAEFLTGRYHPRCGVRGVSTGLERLNLDEKTLADTLRAAGYATGAFGKWHNGSQWPYHPNARGFQEYYGFASGHWGQYFNSPLERNGQPARGEGYIADDLTNQALAFIEAHRAEKFFCYLPLNTPHSPFCVPDEYWQRFKDKELISRATQPNREEPAATRCALAMCENIDYNVGRILKKLDEWKLAENTIVIYFSDNGPNSARFNGGMKGIKGSTDEGGVRSPFFIRWPGQIPGGTIVKSICGAIDLLPTLTKLMNVDRVGTKPWDGRDLSPLLAGKKADWPDRELFSHWNGRVSVRTQQYRLDDRGALYDMAADPGQEKDVAAAHPDVAKRLQAAVAQWRKDVLPMVKDDRPYPVGYAEFPRTVLPARDGVPHGGVKRSANAPNCSYFVNWSATDDSMTWDVEVATSGKYSVELWHTVRERDLGATVELAFRGAQTRTTLVKAWDPPLIDNEDRVPRRGESVMKEFQPLTLEPIALEKGRGQLTLRATKIPGRGVCDVRAIVLTLQK